MFSAVTDICKLRRNYQQLWAFTIITEYEQKVFIHDCISIQRKDANLDHFITLKVCGSKFGEQLLKVQNISLKYS